MNFRLSLINLKICWNEIRNGHVTSGEEHINVLLSSVDVIKAMIAARIDGEIYSEDYSVVMANLDLLAAQQIPPAPTPPPPGKSGGTSAPGELSEYEKLEMLETAEDGEKVLRIRVFFDESNPMNTVGGIQVFAKIKELGQILKTTPDFDSLYEDIYHPVVDYFVSTKLDEETLEQSAHISEVTSQVLVGNIEDEIQEDEPVLPEAEDDIEESEISPITEAKDETREDKPPSKTTPSPKMGKEAGAVPS